MKDDRTMAASDDDSAWVRQLLLGLGALAVVSLLVGGIVGALALGAARITGLDGSSAGGPVEQPSLYMPTGKPTTTPQSYPDPSGYKPPSPSESASPDAEPSKTPRSRAITLQAFPNQVSPGERINLTGVYQRGEGATLQVQRFENGGWADFPVTVSVSGGVFSTYIMTSRTGEARLRVYDKALQKASNAVRVTIG
jgi:hypothetical protein